VLAGGGDLPRRIAEAVEAGGRRAVVIGIAGEAERPPPRMMRPFHMLRWGEVGRLLDLLQREGASELVFAGRIVSRPTLSDLRPDFGALRLMPRIVRLLAGGDHHVLSAVAALFEEHGYRLLGPLEAAPALAMPEGPLAGRAPGAAIQADLELAARAARTIGALDIGQAAVAVGGRVVAVEGAEGTDGLLARLGALRAERRIPGKGGVLVKCAKPQQDLRLDPPAIGPDTAERAAAAGLAGIGVEARRTVVAGRAETAAAFERRGLFLIGLPPAGAIAAPADLFGGG